VRGNPRGLALDRNRVLAVHRPLDVPAMQEAAAFLAGRHDFAAFATQETRSTVREVFLCELRQEHGELRLHVAGDGFLRNMIRTIMGTLLWAGTGRLAPADLPGLIRSLDRRRTGPNVPPWGLYFAEAGYRPWDALHSEQATRARLLF
jgi:tRNA pseudouridine38-40 synthase